MSQYPPPLNWTQSIFNYENFPNEDDSLTLRNAYLYFIKKTGSDTAVGPLFVSNPVQATVFKATQGTYPDAAFTNSTNLQTGLYFGTTTTCGIICNGAGKMTFGTSATTSFQPIVIPDSSAATPGLSFSSVTNAGLYYAGANQVAISSAGGRVIGVDTSGLKLYGSTSGNNALYLPSGFQYYQEETIPNFTFTFGINTQSTTIQLTRIGRICHFSMDGDVVRTPSGPISSFSSTSAVPVQYRPTSLRKVFGYNVMVDLGGTKSNDYFAQINTAGTFTFTHRTFGASSSAQHTLHACTFSWTIGP